MVKHKISISISSNYKDVYEFLKDKPNISNYVCEIVRKEMASSYDGELEKKIEEIVNRLLQEKSIVISDSSIPANPSELMTSDDMDLIKNIF